MLVNLLSIAVVAVAASCFPSVEAACHPAVIKNLVVFGDSLSDIGNAYKLTHHQWPLSKKKYYHGRFSNGPIWTDDVGKKKGYKVNDQAYGGATTDSKLVQGYTGRNSDVRVPGFTQQIKNYVKSKPKGIPETLFVVNFQGNDYFFNSTLPPSEVVGKIRKGIDRLVDLGAKQILVVQNINMGLIPYFSDKPAYATAFTEIAAQQQVLLKQLADRLHSEFGTPPEHPFRINCKVRKVNFGFINLWDVFAELYKPDQLARLGITDVVHGCVSSDYSTVCKNPDELFYWDDFHPSRKIHKEIAKAIVNIL
ncbi:MAG: GDSL lipase/esterase [Benniella sp.]|nr:MAG: GDSL lipase/esterase [Benniella sp.]